MRKISNKECKSLLNTLLYQLQTNNLAELTDKIGKHSFYNTVTNEHIFYKKYEEALNKIIKLKCFKELPQKDFLLQLIILSKKLKIDLFSRYFYYDDLSKDLTNLPVQIWICNLGKKYLPRIFIQNNSNTLEYLSNILEVSLYPKIEINDRFNFGNKLTKDTESTVLNWIINHKNDLINATKSEKDYVLFVRSLEKDKNDGE